MALEKEKKAIKHLQERTKVILAEQNTIHTDIDSINEELKELLTQGNGFTTVYQETDEFECMDTAGLCESIHHTDLDDVYKEAMSLYTDDINAEDLLSNPGILDIDKRIKVEFQMLA